MALPIPRATLVAAERLFVGLASEGSDLIEPEEAV